MSGRDASAGGLAGLLAHRGLLAVASGGAMAEAGLLLAVAPAARALGPQLTAVAPLAVYHDLRWLYGDDGKISSTLIGFWCALVVLTVARTLLNAALVRLAWPRELARPPVPELLRTGAVGTVLMIVALSPLVTLTFGVAMLPFSWPLLAALPVLLLMTALLSHAGVAPAWWRAMPPARAAAWALASFVVLSVAAAVTGWLPAGWAVPVAGLAGLFNARAWCGVSAALAGRLSQLQHPPALARLLPVGPLAVIIAVAMVVGSLRLMFSAAAGGLAGTTAAALPARDVAGQSGLPGAVGPGPAPSPARARSPVLEIAGFGSSCCTRSSDLSALAPGGMVRQFSYRGLTPAGQPRPYGRAASDLPLAELGDRIAEQVRWLHLQTGKPVNIVAESEGTLGVYAMLALHPHEPLGSVVLLSPILTPGQVSYSDGGRGQVPGYELRAVVSFIGSLSPYGASGATELLGSVNRSGARYLGAAVAQARRHPFRMLAVIPLADAVTLPACALPRGAIVVPAWHGALSGDAEVQQIIREFLAGRTVRPRAGLQEAAETVAAAATAWRIPEPADPSPPCEPARR
jgi:hypothetical protein